MNRTEKGNVVAELADQFNKSAAVFFADYRGLTVAEMTSMRRELDKVQASMRVVKNRLMKQAIEEEARQHLEEYLCGPTAVTFVTEDAVSTAKVLAKYQKELEPFEIRGGFMRGEVLGAKQVDSLSKLPSREELYAKLLGTMSAPASQLVRAIQGVSQKLVRVLAAIRDVKESQ